MIFANTLAANFTEVKTVVYWAIAIVLILATKGWLGVARRDKVPMRTGDKDMEVARI